jgi:molybdate transport system substrate-binding protein
MITITDDIRVMTSGAFTAAYLELIPRLELLTKKKLVTAATSIGTGETSIPSRLRRGEPVDVVIVADAVLIGFINEKLIIADSYTPLARSAIGMAVRAGAPKPDISTVDALKRSLLAAKSVVYADPAKGGLSGVYFARVLDRLGIADQMKPKTVLVPGDQSAEIVAKGEAEIGVAQTSEIIPVAGAQLVGPLPGDLNLVTVFSAGLGAGTKAPDAATSYVKFITGPTAAAVLKARGMDPK